MSLFSLCSSKTAEKEILHKVNGTFPSGSLIAIMGDWLLISSIVQLLTKHFSLTVSVLIAKVQAVQASQRSWMHSQATHRKVWAARCMSTVVFKTSVSHRNEIWDFFLYKTDDVFRAHVNSAEDFKKSTSYITQDDRLQLLLTVIENMRIAAELKLGGSVSRVEKNKRVSGKKLLYKIGSMRNKQSTSKTTMMTVTRWHEMKTFSLLLQQRLFDRVKWEFN